MKLFFTWICLLQIHSQLIAAPKPSEIRLFQFIYCNFIPIGDDDDARFIWRISM